MRRLIQFKYLYYKDYQESGGVNNNGERMTVNSPALYMLAPISDSWVFEIGAVYDNISRCVALLPHDAVGCVWRRRRRQAHCRRHHRHQVFRPHCGFSARCLFDRR